MDAVTEHLGEAGAEIARLLLSIVLVLPIGFNRERWTDLAGLRTFPLVAFACCAFVLLGKSVLGDNPEAQSRIIQGLMTGIGFIGGGAILKRGGEVHGTSTAAAIWATALVGSAVAYDRYVIATAVSAVTYIVFRLLTPLGRRLSEDGINEQRPDDQDDHDDSRRTPG